MMRVLKRAGIQFFTLACNNNENAIHFATDAMFKIPPAFFFFINADLLCDYNVISHTNRLQIF